MRVFLVARWVYIHEEVMLGAQAARAENNGVFTPEDMTPALLLMDCIECKARHTVVSFQFEKETGVRVIRGYVPSDAPGVPDGVAFYLDQARGAIAEGKNSAAVAMYRSALDQVLFHQGFEGGMVDQKIEALKKAVREGTAPEWADRLETSDMKIINRLGRGAVHARAGKVKAQQALDDKLVQVLDEFFAQLLYQIYEHPKRAKELRSTLNRKAQILESEPDDESEG